MRFIFFVFISLKLSAIVANNYHLCTSQCSGIDLSFADALNLPEQCQINENNPEDNSEVSAAVCSVEYRINYRYERVRISFSSSNETEHGHSAHLEQTISFSLQPDFEENDETVRRFSCQTKNDCAREFYLNTIGPLVAEGNNQLSLIKNKLYNRSLLMGPHSKRRCIDSEKTGAKPSVLCRTGLCHALFVRHHHQNETKTQKCDEYASPYLRSQNEYHLTDSIAHIQKEFLEYRCNKNICNRYDMIEIIHKLLSEFSHLPTSKVLPSPDSMPNDGKQDIQTKTSSSTSIRSSYFLVLFYTLLKFCF